MNDQPTATEERRAALDKFAEAPPTQPNGGMVNAMPSPADRAFGAIRVAVYRDEARVLQRLSALGAAAGDDWFYRYPVKNRRENRTDWIEGASIKLANDVARIYGNCDIDTRVLDLGDTWVIYARFTDYETGYSMTRPFQQRKGSGKIGGDGGDADARRLDMAFQIGVSKAIRNVVTNALQTYSDYAFDAARNSLVDKIGKDIVAWRNRVLEGLAKIPVEPVRVEKLLGRASKDWLAPDVAKVIAMMKAIADGMATAEETFPTLDKSADDTTDTSSAKTTQDSSPPATSDADQGPAPQSDSNASQASQSGERAGAEAVSNKAAKNDAATDGGAEIKPDSETSYVAYANAKIAGITDPAEGRKWWAGEKTLRNKCNVTAEVRDGLKAQLDAKCGTLEKES